MHILRTTEETYKPGSDGLGTGGKRTDNGSVVQCSAAWSSQQANFLKQTSCIPTPTDSDAVAWEKKGEEEVGRGEGGGFFNRMQLNCDYKWLSISSWACYSCKEQHYWEGCTKLQEGKSRLHAVRGNDGRWVCAVPRSLLLIDGEKQESMFLTQVTVHFPLNTQVVVQCILLTFTHWATLGFIYFMFEIYCLTQLSVIYQE